MSSTKVLWGQTCIVLGVVVLTMWAATQWVAWKLGFQPRLGLVPNAHGVPDWTHGPDKPDDDSRENINPERTP